MVGVGEALPAAQAGFLSEFPELWLVWAKLFLQARLFFTEIPRGVFGVGETPSAAQAGFYRNS